MRFGERHHVEIDLQRGVLEVAELLAGARDRGGDLLRRADPGGTARNLVGGGRCPQFGDHLVVAGIIHRGAAVEPIRGCVDQGTQIGVEQRAGDGTGALPVLVTEHMEGEHHLALPRVDGILPGAAVGGEQRAHHRSGERDRHDRMAHTAGKGERVGGALRGDVEFRARLLSRARQRGRVFDRVKTAAMGDVLSRQQELDLLDPLAEAGHRLVRGAAEPAELVRQEGAREADIEATATDRIQHADLAGELQRVVEDRQHSTRNQPRVAGALSGGSEEQHRVGAVPAVVMKIMLDNADVREPELIGLLRKI